MGKRNRLAVMKPRDCEGCGACCTEQAGLPASWYVPAGAEGGRSATGKPLPPELIAELKATVAGWLRDGFPADDSPCIWYDADSRQCRHYEYRPAICGYGVKVGDAACMRWRKVKGIDAPSARPSDPVELREGGQQA